jgi:putative FmdB family regulatory protein
MPIYEYRCDNCGHELETIQKLSEAPLTTCPACGNDALRKKVSRAGFRLKGGGWYETDFKSGNKRNVAAGGSADGGSGSGESGGNSGASASSEGSSGSSATGGESKSAGAAAGGSSKATASE